MSAILFAAARAAKLTPPRDGNPLPHALAAQQAPERAGWEWKTRLMKAAAVARTRYPGVIGQYLAADIEDCANWGYRVADTSRIARVAAALLDEA